VTGFRSGAVRWGILGAANIARSSFLPGLREAGGGRAVLVGGRDGGRARTWAADNGVDAGVDGYEAVVASPQVDAVYVALPNSLHGEWTRRALEAGKVVLCEKPLCVDGPETSGVLDAARTSGSLLWEAFVFPWSAQQRRLLELLAEGAIGALGEIRSSFHFSLTRPGDIRLSAELGGGSLGDIGCYPVQFAQDILGPDPGTVTAASGTVEGSVETEAAGVVRWDRGRLVMSCGFRLDKDTSTTLLGTEGRIHLTNPFHPRPHDTLTVVTGEGDPVVERPTTDAWSFAAALRHIHGVVQGTAAPEHLAVDTSQATAEVLDALRAMVRSSP
jgi:predicted dehydrogenase